MAQAQAQITTRTVERVVTEEVAETQYLLVLTKEEAILLRGLVGNVNGGRARTASAGQSARREITDAIWLALVEAGIPSTGTPYEDGDVILSSEPWEEVA